MLNVRMPKTKTTIKIKNLFLDNSETCRYAPACPELIKNFFCVSLMLSMTKKQPGNQHLSDIELGSSICTALHLFSMSLLELKVGPFYKRPFKHKYRCVMAFTKKRIFSCFIYLKYKQKVFLRKPKIDFCKKDLVPNTLSTLEMLQVFSSGCILDPKFLDTFLNHFLLLRCQTVLFEKTRFCLE